MNIWIPFSQVIFTGGLNIGNRVSRKMGSSASRTLVVTSWPPSFNSLHVGGPGRCFCRYFLEEKMFAPPLCSFSGFLLLCFSDSLHFFFLCCFPGLFLCFFASLRFGSFACFLLSIGFLFVFCLLAIFASLLFNSCFLRLCFSVVVVVAVALAVAVVVVVVCYCLLFVDCCLLVVGCGLLVVGCWLLVVGCCCC